MKVAEILQLKGAEVHSIGPQASLEEVVATLVRHNCGSLLVIEGDQLVGIITERDILRTCDSEKRPLSEIRAEERMSKQLVTGTPDDKVNHIMGVLTENRIRHLPILDNGKLAGVISIGDVVKAQHARLCLENEYLKEYIQS